MSDSPAPRSRLRTTTSGAAHRAHNAETETVITARNNLFAAQTQLRLVFVLLMGGLLLGIFVARFNR